VEFYPDTRDKVRMTMTLVHWHSFTSPVVVVTWWLTLTLSCQVATDQHRYARYRRRTALWQLLLT